MLGAVQVMLARASSGPREANGMCVRAGLRTRSWWISSDTTRTPLRAQISPMVRSSASVQTLPVGLWGWLRMNSLVSGRMAASKARASNR